METIRFFQSLLILGGAGMLWVTWKGPPTALRAAAYVMIACGLGLWVLRKMRSRGEPQEAPSAPAVIPPEVLPEVRKALAAGRKIEAIKIIRQATGCDLLSAKLAVDKLDG